MVRKMINSWFSKNTWNNWYKPPKLSWWIDPSGTPKPWKWYHYIFESPISAHALGTLIGFLAGLLITWGSVPQACLISLLMNFYGQLQKGDALIPKGQYNIQNVLWRMVIVFVVLIPIMVMWR
jgi:hypothetical protein